MENFFGRWFLNLFILSFVVCEASHPSNDLSSNFEEDGSLVLPEDESEYLVSLTGRLQLGDFPGNEEDGKLASFDSWILRLDAESFHRVCRTPVRACFHTPASIRSSRNSNEVALTGDYDKKWLHEHEGQTVTIKGYLWHAHTGHHHTPVMLDSAPWFE